MTDWKQRVAVEAEELAVKIVKLDEFLKTKGALPGFGTLSNAQYNLLHKQLDVMLTYHEILILRLHSVDP